MKVSVVPALIAAGLLLAVAQGAHASEALARSKNCLSCHTVDKKVVGPSYKDIALKYKGKGVEATLARKIREGGSGTFGSIPMPASPQVSEAEAQQLARWILSL